MSTNQPGIGPQPPSPPPPRGMSTGVKVLLIVGIIFFVLVLLCCGGLFLIGRHFAQEVSYDPVVVKATTDKIAQIEIPELLKPKASMDLKVPIVNKTIMKMATYADDTGKSTLKLAAMGDMFAGQNEAQMRASIDQSLQQQGVNNERPEQIQNGDISTKDVQIGGKTAKFTIIKGQGTTTHSPRIQVNGGFQGHSGPAMLILDADAEKLTPEKVNAMLESIH